MGQQSGSSGGDSTGVGKKKGIIAERENNQPGKIATGNGIRDRNPEVGWLSLVNVAIY
jgi:hypothetical protein